MYRSTTASLTYARPYALRLRRVDITYITITLFYGLYLTIFRPELLLAAGLLALIGVGWLGLCYAWNHLERYPQVQKWIVRANLIHPRWYIAGAIAVVLLLHWQDAAVATDGGGGRGGYRIFGRLEDEANAFVTQIDAGISEEQVGAFFTFSRLMLGILFVGACFLIYVLASQQNDFRPVVYGMGLGLAVVLLVEAGSYIIFGNSASSGGGGR